MKKTLLILAMTIGACATEQPQPREQAVTSNLCTADDPDCGAPGSNPVDPWTEASNNTYDYAAQNYPGQATRQATCTGNSHSVTCTLVVGGVQIDCWVHVNPIDGSVSEGCAAALLESQ